MQSNLSMDNISFISNNNSKNSLNSLTVEQNNTTSKISPDEKNSNSNIKNYKPVLNSTAASDIAREFAEILIADQKEGYATVILKECLRIPNMYVYISI
jgi:hypothetical protein